MYIKTRNSTKIYLYEFVKKVFLYKNILLVFIIFFFSIFISVLSINLYKNGYTQDIKKFIKNIDFISVNYLKGFMTDVDKITINIDFENYNQLNSWRLEALEKYSLRFVEHDYVSAELIHANKSYLIDIRLKGSTASEHLSTDKWSFRVDMKNNFFYGMNNFSLMAPERRMTLMEWFLRKILYREGMIEKKYDFIRVNLNGEDLGIYSIDEGLEKTMIERNKRREGPIIRLDRDPIWIEKAAFTLEPKDWDHYYYSAEVIGVNMKRIIQNDVLYNNYLRGKFLFDSFRDGSLTAKQVFDIGMLSKYMAINNIFDSWHGALIFNLNFYYNPITDKLEPIPDDNYGETLKWTSKDMNYIDEFSKQLIQDLDFAELYLKELELKTQKKYLDKIFHDLEEEIINKEKIIHKDNLLYKFPKENIYNLQSEVRESLESINSIIAYLEIQNNDEEILLYTSALKSRYPIELIKVIDKNGAVFTPKIKTVITKNKNKNLEFNKTLFLQKESNTGITTSNYRLIYKVLGTEKELQYKLKIIDNIQDKKIYFDSSIEDLIQLKFIELDKTNKIISIKKGKWLVDKDIVIPKNYELHVHSDTVLDLINHSSIVSYSPVFFDGDFFKNILVKSSDKTGQGLLVLNTNDKLSKVNHTIFQNLDSLSHRKKFLNITGAITFYKSPVKITNSKFLKNYSEDFINIIDTQFEIENIYVDESYSDAIDIDFGNGHLSEIEIINSSNDAVDFSGSNARLHNIKINSAGDKAISVGENSEIKIKNIEISKAKYGIVSKDLSNVYVKNVSISDSFYGFGVYQKKPEFGPGKITAESINLVNDIHAVSLKENIGKFNSVDKINHESTKILVKLNTKEELQAKSTFFYSRLFTTENLNAYDALKSKNIDIVLLNNDDLNKLISTHNEIIELPINLEIPNFVEKNSFLEISLNE